MMQSVRIHKSIQIGLLLSVLVLVVGCGKSPPAKFRLNMPVLVDNEVSLVQQQGIADILLALFGTPDSPHIPAGSHLNLQKLAVAAGTVRSEEDGTKHGLFRRHCVHCHGVSGDGRGPTAMFLDPYPRDYRPALFKFKGTARGSMPSNDDLRRILTEGIPGTAMPSFRLLAEDEIDALVEYVKYLAIRGKTEITLAQFANEEMYDDDDQPLPFDFSDEELDLAGFVLEAVAEFDESWAAAADETIRPDIDAVPAVDRSSEELEESIAAGRKLFYGVGDCVKCHGPTALGDGQTDDWNDWNKSVKQFVDKTDDLETSIDEDSSELEGDELAAEEAKLSTRQAVAATLFPVRKTRPRNLRAGVYRGGRRPLDLFWRVHEGINGTPMPAAPNALTEEQLWQIVDYIRALPYEPASRPQQQLPAAARERL